MTLHCGVVHSSMDATDVTNLRVNGFSGDASVDDDRSSA